MFQKRFALRGFLVLAVIAVLVTVGPGRAAPPGERQQAINQSSGISPATGSAQVSNTVQVTVNVPSDAQVWFDGSAMASSNRRVRLFQSPPLRPGRYTYEIRARWQEFGREVNQTQKVAFAPGDQVWLDFPAPVRSTVDLARSSPGSRLPSSASTEGFRAFYPPSGQVASTAQMTVLVPSGAEVWVEGSAMASTGGRVREFQTPPLRPGRYTYEIRARWQEFGREVNQTQKVAFAPGDYVWVDFPAPSGTR
jgi:uncharacterized protein (TIGR03000 family)